MDRHAELSQFMQKFRAISRQNKFELEPLLKDKEKRRPIVQTPTLIEVKASEINYELPVGTAILFFGSKNSDLFKSIIDAIWSKDLDKLQSIREPLMEYFFKNAPNLTNEEDISAKLIDSDVYFDVRFAGKNIGSNLSLYESEIGAVIFPTNGSSFNQDSFKVAEYIKTTPPDPAPDGDDPDDDNFPCDPPEPCKECLDYAIVNVKPELSELEEKTTDCVPEESTEMACGTHEGDTFATPAALVVAVAYTVYRATVENHREVNDRLKGLHLSKNKIRELGAFGSLNDLLSTRRKILSELF